MTVSFHNGLLGKISVSKDNCANADRGFISYSKEYDAFIYSPSPYYILEQSTLYAIYKKIEELNERKL